jgi:hypothetical protein
MILNVQRKESRHWKQALISTLLASAESIALTEGNTTAAAHIWKTLKTFERDNTTNCHLVAPKASGE